MNRQPYEKKKSRGGRWTALATSVRARNPICERCKEAFSEETHHTVPLHRGGSLFDSRNLVALCKNCHKEISRIGNASFSIKTTYFDPEGHPREGTAHMDHPWIRPEQKKPRASLGTRLKWKPNRIK